MINDLLQYRHFLRLLVYRDLKMRYAGSLLGSFWNFIHPIILVVIYIVVIGQIIVGKHGGGTDGTGQEITLQVYAIHLCAGIIPWLLFSEIVSRCSTVLLENANFLRKLAFPAVILPVSVFINAMLVHGVSAIFLMTLLTVLGKAPFDTVLLYFLPLLGMALTALGLGMILSVLNVYFRDAAQFLQIILQLLFWMLPIVYFRETMPEWVINFIDINPLSYPIRAAQAAFDAALSPTRDDIPHMVLLPFATLLIGYRFFSSQRRAVLDEL
jgi:lipopolysaccharide transport system permease protein